MPDRLKNFRTEFAPRIDETGLRTPLVLAMAFLFCVAAAITIVAALKTHVSAAPTDPLSAEANVDSQSAPVPADVSVSPAIDTAGVGASSPASPGVTITQAPGPPVNDPPPEDSLAELKEKLDQAATVAESAMSKGQMERFETSQGAWFAGPVQSCGDDSRCLISAYKDRIRVVQSWFGSN